MWIIKYLKKITKENKNYGLGIPISNCMKDMVDSVFPKFHINMPSSFLTSLSLKMISNEIKLSFPSSKNVIIKNALKECKELDLAFGIHGNKSELKEYFDKYYHHCIVYFKENQHTFEHGERYCKMI